MTHRVVQLGTGNIGYHSLRQPIQRPDCERTGYLERRPNPEGRRIHEILGRGELEHLQRVARERDHALHLEARARRTAT